MKRLPIFAFGALVAASVGAFFVTQHLKVTTPLVAGNPGPRPAVISPGQTGCGGFHSVAAFSFYLLHRADDVDVYVVDRAGDIVRTLASGRHMPKRVRTYFPWNGRTDNGPPAPDGTYYFRIALIHQGRTVDLSNKPITVKTVPPHPVVTSVTPSLIPQGASMSVTIRYQGSEDRSGTIRIYRTDLPGAPRLVKSFITPWHGTRATWDGKIRQRPAPAGAYLIGFDVTDSACNIGRFPPILPPLRGSTLHAGVTVRYLAAEPPLDPTPAGAQALVYVDSRQRPYAWTLTRPASPRKPLAKGASRRFVLRVRLPARLPGLYELAIRSGPHTTAVPLVATAAHSARRRVLVVLPALTWQGLNPVDDDDDGVPDTLDAGGPIVLDRPLANGLPAGLADEEALLAHLDKSHLGYDLTTDLALVDGAGGALSGHSGVVLAGSERWLPGSLASALRVYVQGGGKVLSLGIGSLQRTVTVQGGKASGPSAPSPTDALGARPGAIVTRNRDLITVLNDSLGIFSGTAGAFPGFTSYQQISPPAHTSRQASSVAGASPTSPSIVAYRVDRGMVIEIGLPGFGSSLAHNVDAEELLARLWTVLSA